MKRVDVSDLTISPFTLLDQDWALLVSGKKQPNLMTVSWGGFGTLWHKPMITVYVRPTRHTYGLLNQHPEFTLNFLGKEHRNMLELCGAKSGRDVDKWTATGLGRTPGEYVSVPLVAQAQLALECRILAYQDVDPKKFLDARIEENYPQKDYHRMFFGELLCAWEKDSCVTDST